MDFEATFRHAFKIALSRTPGRTYARLYVVFTLMCEIGYYTGHDLTRDDFLQGIRQLWAARTITLDSADGTHDRYSEAERQITLRVGGMALRWVALL